MKKLLLMILLFFVVKPAMSQSFTGIYGGAGVATSNNYDLGINAGAYYYKSVMWRMAVGAQVFMQQYNIYYDKERNQQVGATIRNNSNYVFIAPMLAYHVRGNGNTHFYINAGVGFNMGAKDSLHKWSYTGIAGYDSTVGSADNVNKMLVRFGVGLITYFHVKKHLNIFISEDVGFLGSKLSETTDVTDIRLNNNVNQIYRPLYISLRLGICWHNYKGR